MAKNLERPAASMNGIIGQVFFGLAIRRFIGPLVYQSECPMDGQSVYPSTDRSLLRSVVP